MNIGIIGAGNIGGALTHLFTKSGHKVKVANSRGPDTLRDLANETGATPTTVEDAVTNVDLIVVTIPENHIPDLPQGLFKDVPRSVVVVDTGNYYPRQRDGRIDAIENGTPESKWVEEQIGHPVIKAFNNIYAAHLQNNGKPHGDSGRIALPVAGDDERAKKTVMELIDQIGFDPVDAGGLSDSWRQQPGSPVYANDYDADGVRKALAEASPKRPADFTGSKESPGSFDTPK